jgi:ribose/xylose/arabinose/galactoside ABC-type transport system permease subunit
MNEETFFSKLRLFEHKRLQIAFRHLWRNTLLVTFVALFAIFSVSSEYFATTNNLIIIFTQLAPLGTVVIGQTLVIITGGYTGTTTQNFGDTRLC